MYLSPNKKYVMLTHCYFVVDNITGILKNTQDIKI